ncbi:2-oxoacid:acceptor oxidoreductase subunit alpha [Carboxydochorda subterranea]|uniref:2-oxoacid:acceptor oxidoreductase subunit alpha n=1 Tax=Carboxydichorda subterranea TaxID=3109565 RepID=A0ABZ1C0G3_9FIRM|nr:2-oxoacid:acceptor oxidoreductase subunit alpha [Limnochorda sp. L945t]WRP17803.1 2-oxoacid:acceptor oxidoreductase subunit alpha [Limnochorda sp. L945t]
MPAVSDAVKALTVARRQGMTIRVAGESGEGVITAGEMLTWALGRAGLWVSTFRTYPAEIKGGPCMFQVRFDRRPLDSPMGPADVLIAFNDEAVQLHQSAVRPGGVILYDRHADGSVPEGLRTDVTARSVPFGQVAVEQLQNRLTKNMVALGATYAAMDLPLDSAKQFVARRFAAKGEEVVSINIRALELGHALAREQLAGLGRLAELSEEEEQAAAEAASTGKRRMIISGNQALAIGAIAGGCRYYAGYPITPASDILEYMAAHLPSFGGVVVQTEDEMAALGSVLGASFGGVPAMTATSGPGLSLMVELIGLGVMSELPAVIVDVQRAGPSTGMPTKTEQGDLNLAVYGGHGDAPRVVMAPVSVRDCLDVGRRAFETAEAYQTPVIVLSELVLAQRTESLPVPSGRDILKRFKPRTTADSLDGAVNGAYRRYRRTEDGISLAAVPGNPAGLHVITGLEHDEYGHPSYEPDVHREMSLKRWHKLERLRREVESRPDGWVERFGPEQARIGLVGWGSTFGSAREAARMAEAMGIPVKGLWVKLLSPLPVQILQAFVDGLEAVIVPELNLSGQFAHYLQARGVRGPIVQLTKQEGLPFSPDEVLARIQEVASR